MNNMMEYSTIVSLCMGLSTAVILQVLIIRFATRADLLKSFFIGFVTGYFCFLLFSVSAYLRSSESTIDLVFTLITGSISYASLAFCYLAFLGIGETSIRTRLLAEIKGKADGLSEADVLRLYNIQNMVDVRIERLIQKGQVVQKGGRYHIDSRLLIFLGQVVTICKLIVLQKKSEFDNEELPPAA
jgi:hypothetical protein